MRDYPVPDSKASLQFFGKIIFYHCFMLLLAEKLYLLHEATKAKGQIITWTTECPLAFESTKSALASATLLHHPHPMTMTNNTVGASDKAVGGKLEQFQAGIWFPDDFFSRKLSNAEQNTVLLTVNF